MADVADKPDKKKRDVANPNLPAETIRYLKQLKHSGVHGKTLGTVARTLIQDQIKFLIGQGSLKLDSECPSLRYKH